MGLCFVEFSRFEPVLPDAYYQYQLPCTVWVHSLILSLISSHKPLAHEDRQNEKKACHLTKIYKWSDSVFIIHWWSQAFYCQLLILQLLIHKSHCWFCILVNFSWCLLYLVLIGVSPVCEALWIQSWLKAVKRINWL